MTESLVQFIETWQKSISQVMTQIAAKPVSVAWEMVAAEAGPVIGDDDLWVRFSASTLGEGAELAFHIRSADALTLSQVFMGEKIDAAAVLNDDSREAVAEASRQIAGRAATELKQSFPQCELTYLQEPIPTWKPEAVATFRLSCRGLVLLRRCVPQYSSHGSAEPAERKRTAACRRGEPGNGRATTTARIFSEQFSIPGECSHETCCCRRSGASSHSSTTSAQPASAQAQQSRFVARCQSGRYASLRRAPDDVARHSAIAVRFGS